jgi:hypothetical protein
MLTVRLNRPALHLLDGDAALIEHAAEIRDLRQHPDRADDREGRGDDAVGDTGHQVAAAGRHLVDRHGEWDAALLHPHQLRRGEPVFVHQPTGVLQPHQHLVAGLGHREHRAHFLAQRGGPAGADVAAKVQHEDALAAASLRRLGFFLALLGQPLALVLGQQRPAQTIRGIAEARVQVRDLETLGLAVAS